MFGRYLVLRQQKIFKTFEGEKNSSSFKNIYKERCKKFYEHTFYDYLVGSSQTSLSKQTPVADDDYAGKKLDQELKRQRREKCFYDDSFASNFSQTLKWVHKIHLIQ